MEEQKACVKCGILKTLNNDNYYSRKGSKSGFRNTCKKCMDNQSTGYYKDNLEVIREYKKQHGEKYYVENKEKISEQAKQRYIENKEKIDIVSLIWRNNNRESINVKNRERYHNNVEYERNRTNKYYQENKEIIALKTKKWQEQNQQHLKEYRKKYRKLNPEKQTFSDQKRRARKRNLPYSLTTDGWSKILKEFNNSCAYCGMTSKEHKIKYNQSLHQDHFVPLTKGGEYSLNNIIPSCLKCNLEKHTKDFNVWYPSSKRYSKEREKAILKFLGYDKKNIQQLSMII